MEYQLRPHMRKQNMEQMQDNGAEDGEPLFGAKLGCLSGL